MAPQRQRSRRGACIAATFLVLCAGAVLQSWRSRSNFDSLRWAGFVVMTAQGKVCLLHSDAAPDGPVRTGLHTVAYDDPARAGAIVRWPNFGYSWPTDPVRRESKLTLVAPLWFVAGLCALPPAWWLVRGRHSARLADDMD